MWRVKMTRINVIPVEDLTDQHLMAEYRELPMVPAAALRSNPAKFKSTTRYTLNKGHVLFFFDKKEFLFERWNLLIDELYKRGYSIDPSARTVHWYALDKFPQIQWQPDQEAVSINMERIVERINQKPHWYRKYGKPIAQVS
jgi:deoxyribonuclease (pyrimidine dimer)